MVHSRGTFRHNIDMLPVLITESLTGEIDNKQEERK